MMNCCRKSDEPIKPHPALAGSGCSRNKSERLAGTRPRLTAAGDMLIAFPPKKKLMKNDKYPVNFGKSLFIFFLFFSFSFFNKKKEKKKEII
jgi:hypothetical protein